MFCKVALIERSGVQSVEATVSTERIMSAAFFDDELSVVELVSRKTVTMSRGSPFAELHVLSRLKQRWY